MDSINNFLKNQLPDSFGLTDDQVVFRLSECMDVLRRYKLDQTQPLPQNEIPTQPFGQFNKITRELIAFNQKKQSTMEEIVENLKANNLKPANQSASVSTLNSIDDSDDYDSEAERQFFDNKHNDTDSLESERNSLEAVNSKTFKQFEAEYDKMQKQLHSPQNRAQGSNTEAKAKQSPRNTTSSVARIIMHNNNVEFVRYQHGIYAPDKTRQSPQAVSVNKNRNDDERADSSYDFL
jgi:hypothetical protein